MKLPPNASVGSGQPNVWITQSRGRFVSQSSFTPNANSGGLGDPIPRHEQYACVSAPRVPSASTVTRAVRSVGGVYPGPGVPSRASPEGVVRTPITRSPSTSSEATGNLVNRLTPAASAFSPNQRTISQIEPTELP